MTEQQVKVIYSPDQSMRIDIAKFKGQYHCIKHSRREDGFYFWQSEEDKFVLDNLDFIRVKYADWDLSELEII